MLYRRGNTWWYKFNFAGRQFRESAKTSSKALARQAERKRHQSLEEAIHGIKKRVAPITFATAATDWLNLKKPTLSPKSFRIEKINIDNHLRPVFGSLLLIDITAADIAEYQAARLKEKASPKTVNLEVGTLRAILRRHRLWADLQPDVKMLAVRDDVGRAVTADEETALLAACRASRSRTLVIAVTLALHTGLRRGEIQGLRWRQVDFLNQRLTVGRSKTESGSGRVVPLNPVALKALEGWATEFPNREPEHFVFPTERYGLATDDAKDHVHSIDPKKPMGSLKESWATAKNNSGVNCRFHDLRHSACTRLLERGVPLPVVASLLGWSAGTTVRMAKRYGHISADVQRQAVLALINPSNEATSDSEEGETST
jgi:integrase